MWREYDDIDELQHFLRETRDWVENRKVEWLIMNWQEADVELYINLVATTRPKMHAMLLFYIGCYDFRANVHLTNKNKKYNLSNCCRFTDRFPGDIDCCKYDWSTLLPHFKFIDFLNMRLWMVLLPQLVLPKENICTTWSKT